MARRTPRTGSSRRSAAPKPARQSRARSKKTAPTTEVEVVEEESGEGFDTAIIVATTVALVVAIAFTDALLGRFGEGVIF